MSRHDMARRREARICELRKAILDYVREHPNASDTATGILTWWLPDVWMHEGTDLIDDTLKERRELALFIAYGFPKADFFTAPGKSQIANNPD